MADQAIAKTKEELSSVGITGLKYHKHVAVTGMEELKKAAGDLPGVLCKNLFAKDKKKKYWLIVAKHDTQINLKTLSKQLGAPSLRMDSKNLDAVLGVKPGAVSPLCVINDSANLVTVVLDKNLDNSSTVLNVHPLTNECTVGITVEALKKFIEAKGNKLRVEDLGAAGAPTSAPKPKKQQPKKQQPKKKQQVEAGTQLLALMAKKATDFPNWYREIVTKSELIEYYDISGCYILRPWSYEIWEKIQSFFDSRIKKLGVKNTYFPLFVSEAALNTEEDHVDGFAPEVAWVTRSGKSELDRPIAVRPTSETIMYPAFSKWIRGHRDLPLKINQWSNVVRWEFSHPTPFIRTREFLWQEGHSAFATKDEASVEVLQILDLYSQVYQDLLAVPVIKGKKTEKEKFAGGYYTTTVEAFIPATGRAIQGATSHCLGQNFAKMFKIDFEDEKGDKKMVWQNSWGLTTRTIGVMIMVHGDDQGLVLPPRVAPLQAVVIPIESKKGDVEKMRKKCKEFEAVLKTVGVRVEADLRTNYNAGWKFKHWAIKGVPLLIKIGQRELDGNKVEVVRRDDEEAKYQVDMGDLKKRIPQILRQMQNEMFKKAQAKMASQIRACMTWPEFLQALSDRCISLSPWCARKECEEQIKLRSGEESGMVAPTGSTSTGGDGEETSGLAQLSGAAKSLCIPFEQPDMPAGAKCVGCQGKPAFFCLFGRSY